MYGVRATQLSRLKQKLTDIAWKIPFMIQWIWYVHLDDKSSSFNTDRFTGHFQFVYLATKLYASILTDL